MKLKNIYDQRNNKQCILLIVIVGFLLIISLLFYFNLFSFFTLSHEEYYSYYIDNVASDTLPSADSGYVLDHAECTNGAIMTWDNVIWRPTITNLTTSRTKCTLYFDVSHAMQTLNSLKSLNPNIELTSSNSSNPDFSIIAPRLANVDNDGKAEQTSGIFALEDDYGVSYYFRGDINYNYVNFAGFLWRIIRINGDGTVRMIFADETVNGIYTKFNDYSVNNDDNAYVGYMYGTPGSNTYEATHANIHDSVIKTTLDNWYESVFLNNSLESYIADEIFCADRSLASNESVTYSNNAWNVSYIQNSFDNNSVLFAPFGRIIEESDLNFGNRSTFRCPNKNDRFTVLDVNNGNGDLTYPIGLITVDEANIAGLSYNYGNDNNYLLYDVTIPFWTMSPAYYDEDVSHISAIMDYTLIDNNASSSSFGFRPVINLKRDAITKGVGTYDNPFEVDLDYTGNVYYYLDVTDPHYIGDAFHGFDYFNYSSLDSAIFELSSNEYVIGKHGIMNNYITSNSLVLVADSNFLAMYSNLSGGIYELDGGIDESTLSSSEQVVFNNNKTKLLELFGGNNCNLEQSQISCSATGISASVDYFGNVNLLVNEREYYINANNQSIYAAETPLF